MAQNDSPKIISVNDSDKTGVICNFFHQHFFYLLYQIDFAIVLYGPVHQHRILSFVFWHEDTNADYSTSIFILKKYRIFKRHANLILRLAAKVDISDHKG